MKDLILPLKKKYFQMWKDGVKKEDYRSTTPYWAARLCDNYYLCCYGIKHFCCSECRFFKPKQYDRLVLTEGYPPKTETTRILYKHTPIITIGIGKESLGAEKDKIYFIIKSGIY